MKRKAAVLGVVQEFSSWKGWFLARVKEPAASAGDKSSQKPGQLCTK